MLALVAGIASLPSLVGWGLITMVAASGGRLGVTSAEGLMGLAGFVAGWLGWAALAWLAAHFRRLGTGPLPRWVVAGLVVGSIVVAAVLASSVPGLPRSRGDVLAILLLGGAPLGFATVALSRHLVMRRRRVRAGAAPVHDLAALALGSSPGARRQPGETLPEPAQRGPAG